jgi:hypothetical protein
MEQHQEEKPKKVKRVDVYSMRESESYTGKTRIRY